MGMTVSLDLYNTIKYLLLNYNKTLIIDADALNTLALYGLDILLNKKCNVIITPHIKEFSRLSKKSVSDILKNTLDYAYEFSNKYDCCIILKSASSVICYKDDISINITGNSGLAKSGSGDMLSGILTGISAYLDISLYDKARLGSYILGRACELCDIPEESITTTDIVKKIPDVIKELK